jgi:hypothetical protein
MLNMIDGLENLPREPSYPRYNIGIAIIRRTIDMNEKKKSL